MLNFDVFISYPHQDKVTADAACAALESEGIRCWIAPRDIVPGADWGASIIDAIAGAKLMVLVFSGHANASEQIKREVERAVNKGIPIIPLRIENVAMSKSLEYFLSTSHWLDALTPPIDPHLKRLTVAVQVLLKTESSTERQSAAKLHHVSQERQSRDPSVLSDGARANVLRSISIGISRWARVLTVTGAASFAIAAVLIIVFVFAFNAPEKSFQVWLVVIALVGVFGGLAAGIYYNSRVAALTGLAVLPFVAKAALGLTYRDVYQVVVTGGLCADSCNPYGIAFLGLFICWHIAALAGVIGTFTVVRKSRSSVRPKRTVA